MKKTASLLLGAIMLTLSAAAPALAEDDRYCKFSLGRTEIQVLSLVQRDLKADILQPATEAQRTAIQDAYPEGTIHNFLNVLLLRGNGIVALVDTGYPWTSRELDAALQHAGITERDITHVILTHAHSDHTGGLLRDGHPVFSKARILFSQKELAFWTNPDNQATASEGLRKLFAEVHAILRAYGDRVSGFTPGTVIWTELPDVRTVDESGHTPGHTGIRVTAEGRTFLFWSDMLHAFAVQTVFPSVSSAYDMDPAAAAHVREKILHQARAEGWLVTGSHVPFVRPRTLTAVSP